MAIVFSFSSHKEKHENIFFCVLNNSLFNNSYNYWLKIKDNHFLVFLVYVCETYIRCNGKKISFLLIANKGASFKKRNILAIL